MFLFMSALFGSGLERLKLSAAGENNLHLLQHYGRCNAALFVRRPLSVTQSSCHLYNSLPVKEILLIYFAHLL